MEENYRLSGKNLFLTYPKHDILVNDLIQYLETKLNNRIVNYILVGIKKTKLHVFVSIEKLIDFHSRDCLNFNGIEGEYIVSKDISFDILQILQTYNIKIQGDCDHPIYLLHQIKEKENEKEKESLKNEFQAKLQEKEKEFIQKLHEKEIELIREKEKIKVFENQNNKITDNLIKINQYLQNQSINLPSNISPEISLVEQISSETSKISEELNNTCYNL